VNQGGARREAFLNKNFHTGDTAEICIALQPAYSQRDLETFPLRSAADFGIYRNPFLKKRNHAALKSA
jgi:hypothetical protein